MCPPVSPRRGASVVQFPAHNACIFVMETPLRERSGGHTGTAPTVSFGQIARGRLIPFGWIACGRLISFGWIACKWLFCLCGISWKNMMEMGRGGACVPTRVALQGHIYPNHNDTHTFLFQRRGRECVMHSRPRCVWGEKRRWREGW